jgi:hypothetical protein
MKLCIVWRYFNYELNDILLSGIVENIDIKSPIENDIINERIAYLFNTLNSCAKI